MKRHSLLGRGLSALQIMALAVTLLLGGGGEAAGQGNVPTAQDGGGQKYEAPAFHTLKALIYSDSGHLTVMPAHMNVVAGDTVTFSNYDKTPHEVVVTVARDARNPAPTAGPLDRSFLKLNETFSYQFMEPGTYEVFDPSNDSQSAHIVVLAKENDETRNSYEFSKSFSADMEDVLQSGDAAKIAGTAEVASTAQDAKQVAAVAPGTTCPTDAPVKTFSILAIDVDITLNRFGYHDPDGKMYVLEENLAGVRAEEAKALPGRVSIGLRDDLIQPLVIRANLGDCIVATFKNQLTTSNKPASIDIHRGAVDPAESGSNVGNNSSSLINAGETTTYTWYIENRPEMEGTMWMHSMGDPRFQVDHGLFGALIAEPAGSTYLDPKTGGALKSGWEAMIVPASGPAFREFAIIYHEIGDETYIIKDKNNNNVPLNDPETGVYRPGTRALNYRSEPHGIRVALGGDESHAYGSYTYGDPPTPMPISYLGDPYKTRLLHGSGEVFHSHHYHGGTVRWPLNPKADPAFAVQRGLDKTPPLYTQTNRLDVQAIGPGESYDLDHECVSGGCQQVAGEFLYHCHFPHHYVGGMWSFYRVYNTLQSNLKELPDRQGTILAAVNSLGLIGKAIPSGRVLTKDTLDAWVESLLSPQGVTSGSEDATVYDWTKTTSAQGSLYFKEPEDTRTWEDFASATPGQRPQIMFDPKTGLLEFPFLTPHLAKRPPFAPGAHGPAPFLSSAVAENDLPTNSDYTVKPADPNRPNDALCPAGSPVKRFNIVGLQLPVTYDGKDTDNSGQVYVLAEEVDDVLAGRKAPQPLLIRANARDCVYVTYVSKMQDTAEVNFFSKTNLHPHFYQFDTQASDGVVTGFSYEQSIRPYPTENRTLFQNVTAGSSTIQVTNVNNLRAGIWIGVGLGNNSIEQHRIASISGNTITLVQPLVRAHASGEAVGTEFVNELWYPDVVLSTVFAHDHVYGTHSWGHGLVSALVVEPPGSTYHDPTTGLEVKNNPIADIHTANPAAIDLPGQSFREVVIMQTDTAYDGKGAINARREPFSDRLSSNSDKSLLFSSVVHGDPNTLLPRAYQGDPTVVRLLQTGTNETLTFHMTGHDFKLERFQDSTMRDVAVTGIAERFDLILEGGAGRAGDYMYYNPEKNHMEEGMWGIFRVHDTFQSDLKPLPDRAVPPGGAGFPILTKTGQRPPAPPDSGNSCPASAPVKQFDIVAMQTDLDLNNKFGIHESNAQIFAWAQEENDIIAGRERPYPLVLWAAQGDCVQVNLTNHLSNRVSVHLGLEQADPQRSSGITVGYNYDQSVAPNQSMTYKAYAADEMGHGMLIDFANGTTGLDNGLYGAISIGPAGARFYDPMTGNEVKHGWEVVTRVPSDPTFVPRREFVLFFQDQDSIIGKNIMPYPKEAAGLSLINYRTEPFKKRLGVNSDTSKIFSSAVHGDPETPILKAYVGDPLKLHVMQGSGYQPHTFFIDGHTFAFDRRIAGSDLFGVRMFGPMSSLHPNPVGGAGGTRRLAGDYLLGNHRMPFMEGGQWGILRVMNPGSSSLPALPNGSPAAIADTVTIDKDSTNNPVNVLANDTDPDSNPLTVVSVTNPQHGTTSVGPGGLNVLYTPTAGYVGPDTFSYTNTDGSLRASAAVTVTVHRNNRVPVAANDTATVARNSSGNVVSVLANDSDPDGNPIIVSAVAQPISGTASLGTSGANVVYTPTTGFTGTDVFTYTVSDGSLTATGRVTMTVTFITAPPVANGDTATVPQNSATNPINVLGNDSDPAGVALSVTSVTQAAHGSVAIGAGGTSILYTPVPGFTGSDSFTYTVTDGSLTGTGTVTVTVNGTNAAPVVTGDSAIVVQGSSTNAISVLANDTDPEGNPLAVTAVTAGAHGSTSIATGRTAVLYSPNTGFSGIDIFTYTVTDGALSTTGTVTVTVNRTTNNAPAAGDDNVSVAANSSGNVINVFANDSDADADAINIIAVTQGSKGSVTIGTGGAGVSYTPNSGFTGSDSFTYTITDGVSQDTATVTVTVQRMNSVPVAVNDSTSVPMNSNSNMINVLSNDSDPEADNLTVTSVTQGDHGSVAISQNKTGVLYTPATGYSGGDTFTYTVSDGSLSAIGTVVVSVRQDNHAPAASDDSATVFEGSISNVINVLSNDSDADDNPISVSAVAPASHGVAGIASGGTNVVYTPDPGFTGTDRFTYVVTDGSLTATGSVTVSVERATVRPFTTVTRLFLPLMPYGGNWTLQANMH